MIDVAGIREFCRVRQALGLSRQAIVSDFLYQDTLELYASVGILITPIACSALVRDLLAAHPLPRSIITNGEDAPS